MMRTKLPSFVVCLLAIAVLLASCAAGSTGAPSVPALVPAEALAAIVVAEPSRFLAKVGEAWTAAKPSEQSLRDPKTLIEGLLPSIAIAEKVIDPGRPWAFVLLPGEGGGSPHMLVELPYAGDPADFLSAAKESGLVEVARAQGYLVLGRAEAPPEALVFPPSKEADLSSLTRWPGEALSLWVGETALAAARDSLAKLPAAAASPDKSSGIQGGFRELLDGGAAAPASGDRADLAAEGAALAGESEAALKSYASSFLSQIASFSAALVPSKGGLALRFALGATPGGGLSRLISEEAEAPSALPWTARLPAEALYSASWSVDPVFARDLRALSATVTKTLTAALAAPDAKESADFDALRELITVYNDEADRWTSALGSRGALSLDLDAAAFSKALASTSGAKEGAEPDPALLAAALPRVSYLAELRDPEGATAVLQSLPASPALAALLSGLEARGLPKIGLESKSYAEGDLGWSELAPVFGAELPPGFEAVTSSLRLRWTAGKNTLVMTNAGLAELRDLSTRRTAEASLATSGGFAAMARAIPQRAQYVTALSAKKIALIATSFSGEGRVPGFDPERFGTWVSWILAEKTRRGGEVTGALLEAGFGLPAGDIGALASIVKNLASDKKEETAP
jgi:hypothetical protein